MRWGWWKLSSNFVLTSLDMLALTKITDITTNKLADMFKEYKSLKVLDLRRNDISGKAAARLAEKFPVLESSGGS